jgi:ABC-2 type transport system ATP-binding protein
MLEIQQLTKRYRGGTCANADISLAVAPGEVFGLLGHNGAGKTTLVSQIVGLVRPTCGTILLDGRDLVAAPAHARRVCSLMPQGNPPLNGLRPGEAIEAIGRLRGGSRRDVRRRVCELIEALDLGPFAATPGERQSGGVRRLVGFCMAAVEPGRLVVLDEPTNDVDPVRRRLLWDEIRRLAAGDTAVLLVTHNVLDAERSVDRLAVLDRGRVVAEGTPGELKGDPLTETRIELAYGAHADLAATPPVGRELRRENRRLVVALDPSEVAAMVDWSQRMCVEGMLEEFSLGPPTLEDFYVRLSRGGQTAEALVDVA